MSKIKAVVLEKSGSRYTVLDRDGTFRQVHRRVNAEVGEEIQIQSWTEYFSGVRIWSGAVALFLLVITSLLGWHMVQAPTAVALLSVDINPSLQLELDNHGNVIDFETQDEEAKRMLSQIDLMGKPIEGVLEQIVSQAYDQKFLSTEQPWIVVGYSPMTHKTVEQMPKGLTKRQITSWVTQIGEKKGLTPKIAVFYLTDQERELAQKRDLTLGEYALWLTAEKAGVVTPPEKLKDTSERVRLLENPQVQVQIKAENKEHQSLSISQPRENGTGKIQPARKPVSPMKDVFPWIEKRPRNDGDQKNNDQQKDRDQENTSVKANAEVNPNPNPSDQQNTNEHDKENDDANANTKANDGNNQQEKDQESYQKKDLNKANDSEHKETQRTKYNKVYVPQIRYSGNLRRDTSRTYKFPEYDRNKQQRR